LSLDVVYGESRDRLFAARLAEQVQSAATEGTIYLGYPVLATADERVSIDALLVSREHGLVAFRIAEGLPQNDADWDTCIDEQDRLYTALESNLQRHNSLRSRRRLALEIVTVTVFPSAVAPPEHEANSYYCALTDVSAILAGLPGINEDIYTALQAALQRVTTIKPAKRRNEVSRADSRGAILKSIEKGIANLDQWQKQAAIESPDGPQRIRGLAGSGKTVVLALKAAYLHSQHPDWLIRCVRRN
jgi:superfamily I DNA and RNA helicase